MESSCQNFCDLSKTALKKLIHEAKVESGRTVLGAILLVKERCGFSKNLNYLEAMARLDREVVARDRRLAKRAHEQRQELWAQGGRTEHWLKKNGPYGSTDAAWFRKRLERATGMSTRDVDERWGYAQDEVIEDLGIEWGVEMRPRQEAARRCPMCTFYVCDDEFCILKYSLLDEPRSPPKPLPVRNAKLAARLRAMIVRLQAERGASPHYYYVRKQHAVHQMDNDEHGEGSPTVTRTSNVVTTEQHSSSITAEVSAKSAFSLVCGDNVNRFETSVNRPLVFEIVEWKTSHGFNSELFNKRLPRDFVKTAEGTINVMPFTVHRYFRGDMLIRVQLNSNKFMAGMLQLAWWYQPDDDNSFADHNNIATASQTLHTLLNAGTSNEAILRVPYRYFKSALEVGSRDDRETSLNMGRFIIRVINPLSVTSSSANHCYFTVFVSFENAEFGGNVKAKLNTFKAKHQMETAAALVAASAVTKFIDSNRDKPTTSAHPMYVAPQPAQSWCLGTNENEAAYSLRLTHTQVPHPPSYADDDFTVSSLASRYGYVSTQTWKSTDTLGTQLFAVPVLPMTDPSHYLVHSKEGIITRCLPPVAYLSNLFQYWRGSLKFRFDFAATAMHTGRLIIGYIPGDYIEDASMEDLYGSPVAYFDLKESQQLEVEIPYVADKMFWPRHLSPNAKTSDMYAPSYLYCFVVAPLAVMDSIANNIQFNIYIAGGADFELAVPAQPSIGLCYNPKHVVPKTDFAYAKTGYYPYYTGTFKDLIINDNAEFGSKDTFFGILRYGTVYGHVSQFYLPKQKSADKGYYLKATPACDLKVRSTFNRPADTKVDAMIPWYDDGGYVYMLPCRSTAVAEKWVKNCLKYNYDFKQFLTATSTPLTYFFKYPEGDDGDSYYGSSNPEWEVVEVDKPVEDSLFSSFSPAAFIPDYPQLFSSGAVHQMDNRFGAEAPTMSLKMHSTGISCSSKMFGENYNDLKDLCRRYQPYALINIKDADFRKFIPGDVLFKFPVMPQGLALDENNPFSNCARDGLIPMLLAGYRYFRGSIRFRIVFPQFPATFFVQHKPFVIYDKAAITACSGAGSDTNTLINHGYAYTIVNANINNVVTIEVPFYLPYDSLLLQQPTSRKNGDGKFKVTDVLYAYTLGEIHVGLLNTLPKSVSLSNLFAVSYSFGDDSRPSVFQGFPPVIINQNIPLKATHQIGHATHEIFESIFPAKEIMKDLKALDLNKTNEKVQTTLMSLEKSAGSFDEVMGSVKQFASQGADSFQALIDQMKRSGAPTVVLTAFSQIAHVINNPSPSTMAISMVSFLTTLGIVSYDNIKKLTDLLQVVFSRLRPEQPIGETATGTHQIFDESDSVAIASMLFAGVSTAMNAKTQMGSKFSKGMAHDLMDGVTSGCRDGSVFFRFFSNVISVILKIFDYIKHKMFPVELGMEGFCEDKDVVLKWAEEAIQLTDPQNEPLYDVVPQMVERVNMCFSIGCLIMARVTNNPKCVNVAPFRELYSKINSLRTMLADKGLASAIRREPFVICMLGNPGIGKSQMAHKAILHLVQEAKVPFEACPIYTHPAGAKYWENVNQEPVLFMDDALILRSGETMDSEISVMMSLKSCALFSPPIAACDRKKKRYAPELVWYHTNTAFPDLANMQCPEAVYRRRDMMWEAALKNEKKAKDYTVEELDACVHLVFRLHRNPADRNCNEWSEWMNFDEFMYHTTLSFQDFRNKQIACHAKKIDALNEISKNLSNYPELTQLPLATILADYQKFPMFAGLKLYNPAPNANHQIDNDIIVRKPSFNEISNALILSASTPPAIVKSCMVLVNAVNIYARIRSFFEGAPYNFTPAEAFAFAEIHKSPYCIVYKEIFPQWGDAKSLSKVADLLSKSLPPVAPPKPTVSEQPSTSTCVSSDAVKPLIDFSERIAALTVEDADDEAEERVADLEVLKASLCVPTSRICDAHLDKFLLDTKAQDVLIGKALIGEKTEYTYDELKEACKSILPKVACRHFFIFNRTYVSNTSDACCFTNPHIKHFCRVTKEYTGCDSSCVANQNLPLLDSFDHCTNHCVRRNKKMLGLTRQLYIASVPGLVQARANKDEMCPEILYTKPVRETMHRILESIKDCFVSIKDYLVKFWNKVTGAFGSICDFLKKWWKPIAGITGVLIGSAGALYFRKSDNREECAMVLNAVKHSIRDKYTRTSSYFKNLRTVNTCPLDTDKCVEPMDDVPDSLATAMLESATHEIIASGDTKSGARAARKAFTASKLASVEALGIRASHQIGNQEVVAQRIIENTIALIAIKNKEDTKGFKQIRALALGDRYVLTVLHAWEIFNYFDYKYIQCFVKDRPVDIQIESIKATPVENSSLVVLRMPANFPQFKRITQFFASEADHVYRAPSAGTLVIVGNVNKFYDCNISVLESALTIDGVEGASTVVVSHVYKYRTQAPGMCGSLLCGDLLNCPIIGMHIAGNGLDNVGFAYPLFRETYAPLFNTKITDVQEPEFYPIDETVTIDLQTTVFPVGSVGKKMAHHSPTNSNIHQSAIHGYVKPVTAPAPLTQHDPRLPPGNSPLVRGCEKHGIVTKNFPPDVLNLTYDRLRNHLLTNCKPLRRGNLVLSDSQSVVGDTQLPYCDPLNWNSSEGYPYYNFRPAGVTDKKWCFKLEESPDGYKFRGFHPMVGAHIQYKREQRAAGIPQPTIFVDCLKDARIAIEKVSTPGKTRIFSMSPVDYTVDFRKYFYDFISSYQVNRLDNFNAIGINKFSVEWDTIAQNLLRHQYVCTGDYSNFGPGLNEEVAKLCLDLILEWYDYFDKTQTLEEARTRACLAYELIGSMHLCHDLVYKVVAGIPSGSPITVVLNSLVNTFYLFAAWEMLKHTFPVEYRYFDAFNSNVVLYTYGDDFIMSVSYKLIEYFNTKTIAIKLAEYDIKMTDAFKGAEITPYASLQNSTFLKGSFTHFLGRWWYGLEKTQIYDMVNFVNSKHDTVNLTLQNAQAALLEAHGHGQAFFNDVKSRLVRAFSDKGIIFQGRTFEECTDIKTGVADDPELRNLAKKIMPLF